MGQISINLQVRWIRLQQQQSPSRFKTQQNETCQCMQTQGKHEQRKLHDTNMRTLTLITLFLFREHFS